MEGKFGRPYRGKRVQQPERKKGFWANGGDLLVIVVVIVVLFRVVLQLAWVPTGSMETTIPARSLLISLRLPYLLGDPQPDRGDVVTFWSDELDKLLVKRVIGLPGDEITFQGGYVYVNGARLDEPYLDDPGYSSAPQTSYVVPEGYLFFLGDNRPGSNDGRFWEQPFIPLEKVQAGVLLVISPLPDNSWWGIGTAG